MTQLGKSNLFQPNPASPGGLRHLTLAVSLWRINYRYASTTAQEKLCIVGFTCQMADSNLLLSSFSNHKGNRSVKSKHAAWVFSVLEIPAIFPAHLVHAIGQADVEISE